MLCETAQQVAHLIRHMSHRDAFTLHCLSSSPDAQHLLHAAVRTVDPLDKLVEEKAAGQLFVEVT